MLEKLKQAWESGHRCDSFAEHQGARKDGNRSQKDRFQERTVTGHGMGHESG